MSVLTNDRRFEEVVEKGGKPEFMSEVLDFFEEKGRAEGKAEGIAEGRAEGRIEGKLEGIDETRILSIKSVMARFEMTADQAMDVLNIPLPEHSKYLAML